MPDIFNDNRQKIGRYFSFSDKRFYIFYVPIEAGITETLAPNGSKATTTSVTGLMGSFVANDGLWESEGREAADYILTQEKVFDALGYIPIDKDVSDTAITVSSYDNFYVNQNDVVVSGAGISAANGTYTLRDQHNNKPYYNLIGQPDSTSSHVIAWNGSLWYLSGVGDDYLSNDDTNYPWQAIFEVDGGDNPPPTVTVALSLKSAPLALLRVGLAENTATNPNDLTLEYSGNLNLNFGGDTLLNGLDIATTQGVQDSIDAVINSAPGALNTLDELAAALGDDANFATTITNLINAKVPVTRAVNGHALSADVTVSKSDVGLGNVDNTSDANKPTSTATQTALDAKASLVSPTFTGNPVAPTATLGDNDTSIATTAFVAAAIAAYVGAQGSILSCPVNNSVLATATGTVYTSPGNDGTPLSITSEGAVSFPMPRSGIIRNLRVRTGSVAQVNTATTTITIRKNGADTGVTLTLTQTINTTSTDITHSVNFTAGDLLTVSLVTTGLTATSTSIAAITFEYA